VVEQDWHCGEVDLQLPGALFVVPFERSGLKCHIYCGLVRTRIFVDGLDEEWCRLHGIEFGLGIDDWTRFEGFWKSFGIFSTGLRVNLFGFLEIF
jgi:hypothetical protein